MTAQDYEYVPGEHAGLKMWTRGVPVEETAAQQLLNIATLPFIHRHVAVMPDVHWGMGATVGSVIPTYKAIIPAAVGVDIGCFVGETKVPLLDGTQKTLAELAGWAEPFWVYSMDANLKIAPGLAVSRKTRTKAKLIRVTVSGGEEIICTPDHEFMMSDGTYREARDLSFNDSLMPLYRRWQTRDGYESVNCGKGKSTPTHIMVWEALNGFVPKGYVVHHRDHIHFNNDPKNLELMTGGAHSAHHRRFGAGFNNSDLAFQAARLAGIERSKADPETTARRAEVGSENITRFMRERPDEFRKAVSGNGRRGAPYLTHFNTSPRRCSDCSHEAANPAALRWHKNREHGYNHKVISVEPLPSCADVYCLTVEGYHNFALAAGVFVHNCGMMAVRTDITSHDLPDDLRVARTRIEAHIPVGRTDKGGPNDHGAWRSDLIPTAVGRLWHEKYEEPYKRLTDKHRKAAAFNTARHLGTLGTGNHFIEACLDEHDRVWVMLHSGSRGLGNKIGQYFIKLAKKEMEQWHIHLPDADLAYLPEGSRFFWDYVKAVNLAQKFAADNRQIMMNVALFALSGALGRGLGVTDEAVDCHHNYVQREHHFGKDVWLTRKGAVSAQEGQLGIIPGSMGARSYIVRGKGNAESFHSCSHGAGRAMSRTEAKKRFTLEDHAAATEGVECRKDQGVLDETPGAYKDIDAVMAAQAGLVDVVHTLRGIVCVKG